MAKQADTYLFDAVAHAQLQTAILLLRAIAHPLRMKLIAYIDKHKEVNVNKIYTVLNLEQSITSQHLKILRTTGYVQTKRNGKYIFYSVNYELIQKTLTLIEKYRLK